MDREETERRRHDRKIACERDGAPVKAALAAAGIDPADFGRFVNRPFPGVLEPSRFDAEKTVPVLLEWLSKIASEYVKESIVPAPQDQIGPGNRDRAPGQRARCSP
jgi:hypothetical protein